MPNAWTLRSSTPEPGRRRTSELELGSYSTEAGQGWSQHTLAFTAGGSGALEFRSLNVGNYDRTSFINGVDAFASVSQVPEPQSFALVLAGLAAVAFVRRRRVGV